jgi:hypothetical protein
MLVFLTLRGPEMNARTGADEDFRGFQLTTEGLLVTDAPRLFPAERMGLSRSRFDGRS